VDGAVVGRTAKQVEQGFAGLGGHVWHGGYCIGQNDYAVRG